MNLALCNLTGCWPREIRSYTYLCSIKLAWWNGTNGIVPKGQTPPIWHCRQAQNTIWTPACTVNTIILLLCTEQQSTHVLKGGVCHSLVSETHRSSVEINLRSECGSGSSLGTYRGSGRASARCPPQCLPSAGRCPWPSVSELHRDRHKRNGQT